MSLCFFLGQGRVRPSWLVLLGAGALLTSACAPPLGVGLDDLGGAGSLATDDHERSGSVGGGAGGGAISGGADGGVRIGESKTPGDGGSQSQSSAGGSHTGGSSGAPEDGSGGRPSNLGGSSSGGAESGSGGRSDPTCGELRCDNQLIMDLGLLNEVSDGHVDNFERQSYWESEVDATAGGLANLGDNAWIYLAFTRDGLARIAINDLQSLESTAWHIAAKNQDIRVNSGVAGPGCVRVLQTDDDFDDLDEPLASSDFSEEDFYDDSCRPIRGLLEGLIADVDYQLLGSIDGGLACVETTGRAFILELGDGTQVAWTALEYYGSGQGTCNSLGLPGGSAGMWTWRWKFLDDDR